MYDNLSLRQSQFVLRVNSSYLICILTDMNLVELIESVRDFPLVKELDYKLYNDDKIKNYPFSFIPHIHSGLQKDVDERAAGFRPSERISITILFETL